LEIDIKTINILYMNNTLPKNFDKFCVNIINYFCDKNIIEINGQNNICFSQNPTDNVNKRKKKLFINYSTNINRYGYYSTINIM